MTFRNNKSLLIGIFLCLMFIGACSNDNSKTTEKEEEELNKVDDMLKRDQERMDSLEQIIRNQLNDSL